MTAATVRLLVALRWSSAAAFAEFRAVYSPRTWVFGWLVRCLSQVAVFGLLGRALGTDGAVDYLVVGTAVLAGAGSVALVIQSTAWERRAGTLPLLVSSPTSTVVAFAGRNVHWLLDGVVVCMLSLTVVPVLFGRPFAPVALLMGVPVVVLTYAATSAFGLVVTALVLGAPGARNLASNVATSAVALVSGVQVPVAVWPEWVERVSDVLPLTHGLTALRGLLLGDGLDLGALGRQLAVLALWSAAATLAFAVMGRSLCRTGGAQTDA